MNNEVISALDLFCGIGGLSLGLEKAGLNVIGGVDNWDDAAKTFEHNHNGKRCMIADVSKIGGEEICKYFGISAREIDVLVGGPPCQGFSTVGKRDMSDPRNKLWEHYLEIIAQLRPAYVLIENVEGMVVSDKGGVCNNVVSSLNLIGYHAKWKLLVSANYGVPQLRKRVIFLAWLDGLSEPEFPAPSVNRYVTVSDAIYDLPSLEAGEFASNYTLPPLTDYQKARRGNNDVLMNHEAANHPRHLVELLSHIPDGGNRQSIPQALQPRSGFHNSYARLASNKPAIAVTSNMRKPSSARTTHPSQNRGLTVREGLRLQTFDDCFQVLGTRTSQYLQVGNSVPPLLGMALGNELIKAFKRNSKSKILNRRKKAPEAIPANHASEMDLFPTGW
ncbi:MAG: DNA cytosine methyltransferase [Gammaproteobacteria bacterium]|nr:DNA cytosine methyltransferase [Gammaproteobacteria bacterium]